MSKIDLLIPSTADERTVNNVMRHEYRILTEEEKWQVKFVKDMGRDFLDFIHNLGPSREVQISSERLEEAVMWAVKEITK